MKHSQRFKYTCNSNEEMEGDGWKEWATTKNKKS